MRTQGREPAPIRERGERGEEGERGAEGGAARPPGAPRRRAGPRWALRAALALGAVALAAFGVDRLGERRAARAAHPVTEGRIALAALEAPAEVRRDARGVPHVEAASERDAYLALGYVHAQDRLAQMLWLRRAARGRTAELRGAEGLPVDRRARTLGLARIADAAAGALAPRPRRLLEAYAAGVNARLERIASGAAAPPRALAAWGVSPERWRPADSIALLALHAWGLDGTLDELAVMADLIERLGGFGARRFFPEQVGIEAVPPQRDGAVARAAAPGARGGPGPAPPLRHAAGLAGASAGSTAWVVAPGRSASGGALLAGDLHVEARVPAPLHEAHLRGGAANVAGAALPGVPLFWTGFTPGVAWASVHAGAVAADLFVESLRAGSGEGPERYHDGTRWRPLEVREETIRVRGAEPVRLSVRRTRHGPLVQDLLPGERAPLALRWAGALEGPGVGGFLAAARARDAEELRRALAGHRAPVLAVAYADAAGEGGVRLAGALPERRLPSGLVPVAGRSRAYDWQGTLPAGRLPQRSLGPETPFVVAADGVPAGAERRGIEYLWRSGLRQERVESLLAGATADERPLDARRLVALQGDLRSAGAGPVVEAALALAGDPEALGREAREVARRLRAWDGKADAESVGAALYHVFVGRLVRELFEPRLGPELLRRYLRLARVQPEALVADTLERAARGGPDPGAWAEPAPVREAVRSALRGTWLHLSAELGASRQRWRWGRLHQLRFRPLLPGAKAGAALGPFPYPGDATSVRVAEYRPLGSFDARVVSAFRLVADAGDLDQALTAIAPGQSEHPGHPHRADRLEPWLRGRPGLLATHRLAVWERSVAHLRLVPEGREGEGATGGRGAPP